ncbi:Metallo-dependent phosphatase-like protein [Calycina marina]|uniref:Metallo-dependent phosphatase-like protein n=1 Tax=Calycina marina TaxID=1763456 RepID=A0A9P8CDF0_9HELO|nr:Metallo-dependent phosphatase-like protein [Calycina marina]
MLLPRCFAQGSRRLGMLLAISLFASLSCAEQPSAPSPVAAPMRPLPWGQLNFLATTDTHGWLAGHLQEPQYSADWGDYISFATRIKEQADERGVDVLLIDCGDRIEGNGIYDASSPKGLYTYDIFRQQHIDVITTGNHELYQPNASDREYQLSVPNSRGNYLASNLDYIIPETGEQVPMAQRFRKFTTKNQKIEVLAFGFLFDFRGNANNTRVQKVENTIKEKWFQDAIREKVDLFVVAGHIILPGKEVKALYEAIRRQNWDTPIQFFGGHSHIRDFHKYDSSAYGIQGGRYLETVGWMSIDGIPKKSEKTKSISADSAKKDISFKRRYIDNNLFGYHYHTGLNETTFPTKLGQNASESIRLARKALDLDHSYGCAPKNLWLSRAQYPSNDSILTWLDTEVMPEVIVNPKRKDVPTLALTNSGAMRFDIFKGPFTRDSTYILSPFISKFLYIKDVPYESAKRVLTLINNAGQVLAAQNLPSASVLGPPEQISDCEDSKAPEPLQPLTFSDQRPLSSTSSKHLPNLIPGYTTKDDGGDDGDDTQHAPISFYNVPNCIQSEISFPEKGAPETVDVVFVDFIQPWVLAALAFSGAVYKIDDVELYREETLTELITGWIGKHWQKEC